MWCAVLRVRQAADVYSFGVLLWEMVSGVRAWEGMTPPQIMMAVACQGQQLEFPRDCPPELIRFPRLHGYIFFAPA